MVVCIIIHPIVAQGVYICFILIISSSCLLSFLKVRQHQCLRFIISQYMKLLFEDRWILSSPSPPSKRKVWSWKSYVVWWCGLKSLCGVCSSQILCSFLPVHLFSNPSITITSVSSCSSTWLISLKWLAWVMGQLQLIHTLITRWDFLSYYMFFDVSFAY